LRIGLWIDDWRARKTSGEGDYGTQEGAITILADEQEPLRDFERPTPRLASLDCRSHNFKS
jgi:hypothetical protein